jgi:hypothetical protein
MYQLFLLNNVITMSKCNILFNTFSPVVQKFLYDLLKNFFGLIDKQHMNCLLHSFLGYW